MTTQKSINDLAYKIIGCAIEVHKELGPGLLESIYQKCMEEELRNKNLSFQSQFKIPIKYKTVELDCDLRLDMKLLSKPKGLLINFNSEHIVNNTASLVNHHFNEYL